MDNITNGNQTTFFFRSSVWITNMAGSVILFFIAAYVLSALLFYEVRIDSRRRKRFSELSLEKKFGILSMYVCILIAIASTVRNMVAIGILWMEKEALLTDPQIFQINVAENACLVMSRTGVAMVTIGITIVYLFLWLRQRIFYIHPSLELLNNKVVKTISFATFLFWLAYFIVTTIAYFIAVQYQFKREGGCLVTESTVRKYNLIIISWVSFSFFTQLILLGLFIHPVLKQALWKSQSQSGKTRLLRRVKKAVALTVICLLTDIVSAITFNLLTTPQSNSVFVIYSINLTINHIVTIFCFDHWRILLWPWKFSDDRSLKKHEQNTSTDVRAHQAQTKAVQTSSNATNQHSNSLQKNTAE